MMEEGGRKGEEGGRNEWKVYVMQNLTIVGI